MEVCMGKVPVPTAKFRSVQEITPEVLKHYGIRCVLTDLDSTLVPHAFPEPDDFARKWLDTMRGAGIPVCIISNNSRRRTAPFAAEAGVAYFYRAYKPSVKYVEKALKVLGCTADEAVFIGDQLFTDIRTAQKAGMKSFLVDPVGTKTTLFIRFKRHLEARLTKEG